MKKGKTKLDVTFFTTSESGTVYRLSPSEDSEPNTGFEYGAVLEWSDEVPPNWSGSFFVFSDAFGALAEMFRRAEEMTKEW